MTVTIPIEVFLPFAVLFCVLEAWSLRLTIQKLKAERLKWFYERLAAGERMSPGDVVDLLGGRRVVVEDHGDYPETGSMAHYFLVTYSGGADEKTMSEALAKVKTPGVIHHVKKRFL